MTPPFAALPPSFGIAVLIYGGLVAGLLDTVC